jgi:penicillin-binding protein 1C
MARWKKYLRRGCLLAAGVLLAAGASFWILDRLYPFPMQSLEQLPSSVRLEGWDATALQIQLGSDEQWRRPVPLDAISLHLVAATIAVEDHRFYEHHGVDPLAILRAATQNVLGGEVISGASTISMQLVKMISAPAPRDWRTKAVEAFRALQLERLLTKQEIIEQYLNLAPYVGNHRGAESAALALFGKHAGDLSLDEATLLAGLPQAPTRYAPSLHAERALARRDRVLEAAVRAGQLSQSTALQAAAAPLILNSTERPKLAPHFSAMALGRRPGGGRSTLDAHFQQRAEELVARHARALPAGSDIAVCVIELESAAVRALVGSADPSDPLDGQVNGATAWRSPGSALKPFIYAAGFEAHVLDASSILEDSAIELAGWRPQNFDGDFSGRVSVQDALRRSLNIPAILAAKRAGLQRVIGVLESAGVKFRGQSARRAGLGLATGAAEVRLIDLTNAYATLGREGVFVRLRLFEDEARESRRVLSSETCAALHQILSSENRVPELSPEAPRFCWKTGTSSGFRDAWALGHDERYAIGVWVGHFSGAGDPAFVGAEAASPLLVDLF